MVLVTGPLGGFSASGSLAGSLVFSSWKGRAYVRRLVTPSNPKTGLQVGVRRMFKFLAQNWANLTTVEQDTWDSRAAATVISPFNAYMSLNQKVWRNFQTPGQQDPIGDTGTVMTTPVWSAAAQTRQITLTNGGVAVGQNWGRTIHKGPTMFTPSVSNCIAVILLDQDANDVLFVDTPLPAGEVFYNAHDFTDDGVISSELGEISATVT